VDPIKKDKCDTKSSELIYRSSKKIIVLSIADPWRDDPVASTSDEEEPDPEEALDVRFSFSVSF
jgi:hypothetical protein